MKIAYKKDGVKHFIEIGTPSTFIEGNSLLLVLCAVPVSICIAAFIEWLQG